MTLQASGAITLADIAAEFGGSTPHSLSEYYRGGTYVGDHAGTTTIPTSGAIDFADFYSTYDFVADYTPDALNWTNISGAYDGLDIVNTNTQTLAGINSTITIEVYRNTGSGTLSCTKNGVPSGTVPVAASGSGHTFTAVSGDAIYFTWTVPPSSSDNYTVYVENVSDGNATLDTFTVITTGSGF